MTSKKSVEELIAFILLLGMFSSLCLVVVGGVFYVLDQGNLPIPIEFTQSNSYKTSLFQIAQRVINFRPLGIVELGLVVLVFTQILRVGLLAWFYASIKDPKFTLISMIIFIMLIYSFFWR